MHSCEGNLPCFCGRRQNDAFAPVTEKWRCKKRVHTAYQAPWRKHQYGQKCDQQGEGNICTASMHVSELIDFCQFFPDLICNFYAMVPVICFQVDKVTFGQHFLNAKGFAVYMQGVFGCTDK